MFLLLLLVESAYAAFTLTSTLDAACTTLSVQCILDLGIKADTGDPSVPDNSVIRLALSASMPE
jgi:hypothetical protein